MPFKVDFNQEEGVTLLEVVVVILILTVVLVAILGFLINSIRTTDDDEKYSEALFLARWTIESVKSIALNTYDFTITNLISELKNLDDITVEGEESNLLTFTLDSHPDFDISVKLENYSGEDLKKVKVKILWNNRRGNSQKVELKTLVTKR